MSQIRTLMGLLRLLRASNGELETRIRVQKEAFLLGLRFPNIFRSQDFEYHHYGPYSRNLSEALQFAVSANLIDEIDESPPDESFTRFRYVLTDAGTEAIQDIPDEEAEFQEFTNMLNQFHWRALELASTVKYLELNESLNRNSAYNKALQLKPKTADYSRDAIKLLDSFN